MAPPPRTLTVTLLSAKNTIACDKGGTSDPYCTLDLSDLTTGKPLSGESFKSKTVKKTLDPTWDESYVFGKKGCNLDSKSQPNLVLNVYDSDTFSSEEMGRVTVSLRDLPQTTEVTDKWYNLGNTEKADNITGSINLQFQYSSPLLTSLPIDMTDPPLSAVDQDPAAPPNELHVLLLKATGCRIMDKNLLTKGGSSDPFMVFSFGENDTSPQKSTVKKKNLAPEWNELFAFPVTSSSAVLSCVMDDHDLGSGNDFMGRFEVAVGKGEREEVREW